MRFIQLFGAVHSFILMLLQQEFFNAVKHLLSVDHLVDCIDSKLLKKVYFQFNYLSENVKNRFQASFDNLHSSVTDLIADEMVLSYQRNVCQFHTYHQIKLILPVSTVA